MNTYQENIINHYSNIWKSEPKIYLWDKGPIEKLPYNFRILEFAPNDTRKMWTYATCCMSEDEDKSYGIELHIFSPIKDESLIELLTSIVYYHRTKHRLNLHHTVNFGRPWLDKSSCNYGLISLPYLDGEELETLQLGEFKIKFFWLIPITEDEIEYKVTYGIEALENKFDEMELDYLNPMRNSIV